MIGIIIVMYVFAKISVNRVTAMAMVVQNMSDEIGIIKRIYESD